MTDGRGRIEQELDTLRTLRDEFKVQAHLGRAEVAAIHRFPRCIDARRCHGTCDPRQQHGLTRFIQEVCRVVAGTAVNA